LATDPDLQARISAIAATHAADLDVDLIDVEVKGARGSRVVRLVADAEDGLDVDRIAALSRRVGDDLEAADVVLGAYTLEVTSPGADRPLRSARDLARNVGRDVRVVRTRAAIDRGEKGEVTGTLIAVDDDAVRLEVGKDDVRVAVADIDHAKVVLPW
jgi:ribosome maturation factor RimP